MDWTALQQAAEKLNPNGGWRCLEELADSPEFRELLHREFETPPEACDFSGVSRRDFLRLFGGTLALAGLSGVSGCVRQPQQTIVPYVNQPEQEVPGKALYYATALEFGGFGRGVVVETHEGRPTKVEGNPLHPASLGATSVFEQATILDLYNPGRSSAVLKNNEVSTWPAFLAELQAALAKSPAGGAGLHLLTGTVTSPAFGQQWQTLLQRYPGAQWHQYEAVNHDAADEGAVRAFGRRVEPQWHFDKAHVVVSFGADFLFAMPGSIRYARDLTAGRNVRSGKSVMNRLYVLESAPTITGAYADDRQAVGGSGPDGMLGYAVALATQLGVAVSTPGWTPGRAAQAWATKVAADLKAGGGPSLLIAGHGEPAELHALVNGMNAALGNFSATGSISNSDLVALSPGNQTDSLKALADAIKIGNVQVLIMLGGNWAHNAPADFDLGALIRKVPLSVHLGLYRNETSDVATWHIPQAHAFESWADTRAFDGTATILQPLIEPLFGGRTAHELLDCVAQYPGRRAYDIIRSYWMEKGALAGRGEMAWRRALHDGVIPGTEAPASAASVDPARPMIVTAKKESGLELVLAPDYGVWDGRYSENAWLQELPRPITRLSWENALLIAPSTAEEQRLSDGDVIKVRTQDGRELRGAVLVQPGVAPGVFAVSLGGGSRPEPGPAWLHREEAASAYASIGRNTGMNVYPVRTSTEQWRRTIAIEKTGETHKLVTTQQHHLVHGRDLVRLGTVADLDKLAPTPVAEHEPQTFYNLTRVETDGVAWAMVIDLTRCIGCNACVLACQSENNIPPVGRHEVERGREMHWIRVDSYYFGDINLPSIAFQPVPCMHCETAPCEPVCPVGATVHDHEGLNVQVYNRCIGTRYCSNNCPYKVRRFNFFNYGKPASTEPLLLLQNPNVTVRARGVMEKCTYCVQRISKARIAAQVENRPIRDGEVTPACAQACPTETIVFGNQNDLQSRVAAFKRSPLNYSVLADQNTRPRTTYLTRITNPV
ncbi:MAG: TAT-variant-translocated molybdopterin oxidoreductase [Verrucomicrobiota bacterium]